MRVASWTRHYRIACFALLGAAYLAVLFGACELHDVRRASHDAVRVLAMAFELGFVALACAGCARLARRRGSAWWLVPAALLAGATGLAYLAQILALVVSNDFVSVLGLENLDSAAFAPAPMLWLGLLAFAAWWGAFCAGLLAQRHAAPRGVERWPRGVYLAALAAAALPVAWLLALQHRNTWLEPGFQQAPLVNLIANAYTSALGRPSLKPGDWRRSAGCFVDPGRDAHGRYPFQKAFAYASPPPYPTLRKGQPNVIVIFTEGTSTRLIGAYGGRYAGLTPNIDRLAARSMRVDNYFNHTAATYRGLIGQLTSGYVFYGGYGRGGWETGDNGRRLGAIRRRTLPMILDAHGYQSYFFSPQATHIPFTAMLDTLGFDRVWTYDSIGKDLLDGHFSVRAGTDSLDDASLFRGLVAFLQRRQAGRDARPFFIGLYNIGTHAFIHVDAHDVKYGTSDNPALNRLHNYDHAVGVFLDYFLKSPYADNTILVFTTDHATYPEADYRAAVGRGLEPYFVDRIPLLIDDPYHRLPSRLDADGRNSLDLAPTLLQLLGIRAARNSFLGASLFEPRSFKLGFTALGERFYLTTLHGIYTADTLPPPLRGMFACEAHVVREYYQAEAANRLVSAAPPR